MKISSGTDRCPESHRKGARVLVVEDDDAMRELLAETLRRDGYDVVEASSGIEAARIIEELTMHEWSARAIDLMVSDVCMAGMSGLQLGGLLREARWSMPMIFITAFPQSHIAEEADRLGATVLAKPFRMELLRRSVLTSIASHVQRLRACAV